MGVHEASLVGRAAVAGPLPCARLTFRMHLYHGCRLPNLSALGQLRQLHISTYQPLSFSAAQMPQQCVEAFLVWEQVPRAGGAACQLLGADQRVADTHVMA